MYQKGRTGENVIDPSPIYASQPMGGGVSDDDFLHLTCQIDTNVQRKIECRDLVDLEKSLPKDRFNKRYSEESKLQWVHRDGSTCLVPVSDKDIRITNVHQWKQAFCVYATIYMGANPQRAKEVWQYVSILNTAASTFIWEMWLTMTIHSGNGL